MAIVSVLTPNITDALGTRHNPAAIHSLLSPFAYYVLTKTVKARITVNVHASKSCPQRIVEWSYRLHIYCLIPSFYIFYLFLFLQIQHFRPGQ